MNCKPGDLAIMRFTLGNEKGTGANLGRICEVLAPLGMVETIIGTLFHWHVKAVGTDLTDAQGFPVKEGRFPDAYLTPISCTGLTEDTPDKEEITA